MIRLHRVVRTNITRPFSNSTKPDDKQINGIKSNIHFDSLKFVEKLEADGFTRQQAEGILKSLTETIQESFRSLESSLVSKVDQEKHISAYKADFAHLKSEIHLLEKNDFVLLRQDTERVAGEVEKLKSKIREDLQRVQSGVRLDMNLDKARARDEQSSLLLRVNDTHAKVEQEIGQVKASLETVRFDTIKTMGAAATSIGIFILGWARYFKS